MLISVLMPAYNEEELIGRAIGSVRESFASAGQDSYEIVVCDNNSTDCTAKIASEMGAKVVPEPHNQIARARNTAAKAASGEWLIFIDADTSLNSGVLMEALDHILSGNVCGGGARMEFDGDIGKIGRFMCRLWNRLSKTFKLAAGAFIFCSAEAFRATGGFSESFYVSEEVWFSLKLGRWGRKRGKEFAVIWERPVITSARKIEWYGPWRVLLQFLLFLVPGAINTRLAARHWYTRPDKPRQFEKPSRD
ncbi:MAG TPA: glycosyltransferase [Acidobacteriota bacterium]|nr:glycosyltransferase [Acidobacteriota bacterium]HNT18627.1 glycosyltransferase [Acidobacteriota bacterium]